MGKMNPPAERQQGFFSVLAQPQTYRHLLYILIIVPLALLHAGLIALGVIVLLGIPDLALDWPTPLNGLGLLLIAPAFGIGLFVIAALLDMQSWVNHKLLGADRIVSPRECFSIQDALEWCRQRVTDRWLWSGLLYLMVITVLGAIAAAFTLLFIALSIALLAGSVAGDMASVQIAIGTFDLGIPGLRMVMIALAPMVAIAGLHLANVMAGVAARIGSILLGPYGRTPSAPAPLSPRTETAYAHRGERATSRGSW